MLVRFIRVLSIRSIFELIFLHCRLPPGMFLRDTTSGTRDTTSGTRDTSSGTRDTTKFQTALFMSIPANIIIQTF